MDLSDVIKSAEAQDGGHAFELLDPVHGSPTGIKLTIAGPDSKIAKNAHAAMLKEGNRIANRKGGETAADRERVMEIFLCTVTLGWEVKEKGKPVPFSQENLLRLIRAGAWVRAQMDVFAGDRSPYFQAGA